VTAYFRAREFQIFLLAAWATLPAVAFMRGLVRLLRRVPNVKLAAIAAVIRTCIWLVGVLTLLYNWLRPLGVEHSDWEAPLIALQVLVSVGWIGLGVATLRMLLAVHRNFIAIRH
jgi:hypothetical protein